MTEEDTFLRLKGLTRKQADEMHDYLYQLAISSSTTRSVKDVVDFIDRRMRVYGWTCDMLDDPE